MLAPEVVVVDARGTRLDGFDARFSATAREYVYRIDEAALPDPFTGRFVWHRPGDLALGSDAARRLAILVGEHDFTSFCRHPGGDRSTVRHLRRLTVGRRAMSLVHPSRGGRVPPPDGPVAGRDARGGGGGEAGGRTRCREMLAARDRSAAGRLAPARGLTLERVSYR